MPPRTGRIRRSRSSLRLRAHPAGGGLTGERTAAQPGGRPGKGHAGRETNSSCRTWLRQRAIGATDRYPVIRRIYPCPLSSTARLGQPCTARTSGNTPCAPTRCGAQLLGHVGRQARVGRGGGGEDRNARREIGEHRARSAMVRPEVVAPAGDAVRLVDHKEAGRRGELGEHLVTAVPIASTAPGYGIGKVDSKGIWSPDLGKRSDRGSSWPSALPWSSSIDAWQVHRL